MPGYNTCLSTFSRTEIIWSMFTDKKKLEMNNIKVSSRKTNKNTWKESINQRKLGGKYINLKGITKIQPKKYLKVAAKVYRIGKKTGIKSMM